MHSADRSLLTRGCMMSRNEHAAGCSVNGLRETRGTAGNQVRDFNIEGPSHVTQSASARVHQRTEPATARIALLVRLVCCERVRVVVRQVGQGADCRRQGQGVVR